MSHVWSNKEAFDNRCEATLNHDSAIKVFINHWNKVWALMLLTPSPQTFFPHQTKTTPNIQMSSSLSFNFHLPCHDVAFTKIKWKNIRFQHWSQSFKIPCIVRVFARKCWKPFQIKCLGQSVRFQLSSEKCFLTFSGKY